MTTLWTIGLVGTCILAASIYYGLPEPMGFDKNPHRFSLVPRLNKERSSLRIVWLGGCFIFKV